MKNIYLAALLFFSLCIFSQTNSPRANKTLADTVFEKGDIVKLPTLIYELSYPANPKTKEALKPVADFIKKHPKIKFEIGVHTDFRGSKESNQQLAEFRAIQLYEFLVMEFGIDSEKMTYRAYGENVPLVSEEEIAKITSNEEKAKMYLLNQRTELKVLE
ncbi:MAG: OmpA family protein [Bacteroidia bacterium]|nr:OmpA family protein [Bacteroidia bacterium]